MAPHARTQKTSSVRPARKAASSAASVVDESDSDSGDDTRSTTSKRSGGSSGASKGKHKVVDTSKQAGPAKKRKGESAMVKSDKQSPFSLELLLQLPFDLFAEICSHLNGGDLLVLSRTCKTLRKVLLGPQSSSIWVASRLLRNLPLPEGMTEQQLADLIHGDTCFACGSTYSYSSSYFLRCRICWSCAKTEIIKGSKIKNGLKDGISPYSGRQQPIEYVVQELWAASATLYELAERDEAAKHTISASRSTRSRRSRRTAPAPDDTPRAEQLQTFVEERKAWVKKEQAISQQLHDTIQAERAAVIQIAEDERLRQANEVQAVVDDLHRTLRTQHGWDKAQTDWHGAHRGHMRVPTSSPDEDAAAWASFRDFAQGEIDQAAARAAAAGALAARREALKPYYDDFKAAQPGRMLKAVPEFQFFLEWPSIKPLYMPPDVVISDQLWQRTLPRIREGFVDYLEELRVVAIRAIIYATTRDWSAAASTNPSDYPEDKYDNDWFERPTALFFGELDVQNRPGYVSCLPLPYPDTLFSHRVSGDRKDWLRNSIDERQVRLIRIILAAVGGTENTMTFYDLCEFGSRYRWVNSPYVAKKEQNRRYNFVELVYTLKRRGPKNYEPSRGVNVPEIAMWPEEDDE